MNGPSSIDPRQLRQEIEAYQLRLVEKGEDAWSPAACRKFIESNARVVDTAGNIVQFVMNKGQELGWELMCEMDDAGLPVFIIVLKERKTGFSTLVQLYLATKAYFLPYRNMLVVAHVQDSSDAIFSYTNIYWLNLDPKLRAVRPLTTPNPTGQALRFAPPHLSVLQVGTAGSTELKRGSTLHDFHGSEAAYWPDPTRLMNAVGMAQATLAGNARIIESTANGPGNWFHRTFYGAMNGDNEYRALFIGLKHAPSYTLLPPMKPLELRPDELKFQAEHDLDDDMIQRVAAKKRSSECDNQWRLLHREFPVTVELAFSMAADFVFDHEALKWMKENTVRDPLYKCHLAWEGERFGSAVKPDFESPEPFIEVWEPPDPEKEYIGFLDTSEGVESDYFIGHIFWTYEKDGWWIQEQVAKLITNSILTWDCGVEFFRLCQWYGWAFLGVESNNQGLLIAQNLEHGFAGVGPAETPYPYLFYSVTQNKRDLKRTGRVGWLTTPGKNGTKRSMIGHAQKAIRDRHMIFRSERTVKEHTGYFFDPVTWNYSQRMEDERTGLCHDDEVMAAAGARVILPQWLEKPRFIGRTKGWSC